MLFCICLFKIHDFFCFFPFFPLFQIFQLKLKVQLIIQSLLPVQQNCSAFTLHSLQTFVFYKYIINIQINVYNFRWEATFYWTTQGTCFCLIRLKLLWTGRVWRTSCRPRLSVNAHDWHHGGRAAVWRTLMMSRLALTTRRGTTDTEVWRKDTLLSSQCCLCHNTLI